VELRQKRKYKIEEANKKEVFDAADRAEAAPSANGKSYDQFVLPEPYFKDELNVDEFIDSSSNQVSFLEAINLTLKEEFRRNPKTFLWGQDVGKVVFSSVVKGMPQEFGKDRVFNAPIAEDCIVGTANGFCRFDRDARVVVEGAEFADYFWPAMEQLVECSHDYWRTKGQFTPNIVIRLASGGYIQGGLYHSQNLEAVFTTLPGIRVVCPSFADDAAGLLRNALRSKGYFISRTKVFI
jgi:2-oxoisovalerate dehydrogenase E1 component